MSAPVSPTPLLAPPRLRFCFNLDHARLTQCFLPETVNLATIRNKLDFARSTNSPNVLDQRLTKDIREFGIAAFSLEILEVLETRPEMTSTQIRDDLATLEARWREKLDPALLY